MNPELLAKILDEVLKPYLADIDALKLAIADIVKKADGVDLTEAKLKTFIVERAATEYDRIMRDRDTFKGDKGDTGLSGKDGVAGKDGALGRDGINGKDGAPGRDGIDGERGIDGLNGKAGIDGKNGTDGLAGKDGVDGKTGNPGKDGLNGKAGIDGKNGTDGLAGKDGVDGKTGNPGKDGLQGKIGESGKNGTDGLSGKDGVDGKQGPIGRDGKDGKDGRDGKDGFIGKTGKDGVRGKQGVEGKQGNTGRDGLDGRDGKEGKQGDRGLTGKTGADGKQGKQGDRGNLTFVEPWFNGKETLAGQPVFHNGATWQARHKTTQEPTDTSNSWEPLLTGIKDFGFGDDGVTLSVELSNGEKRTSGSLQGKQGIPGESVAMNVGYDETKLYRAGLDEVKHNGSTWRALKNGILYKPDTAKAKNADQWTCIAHRGAQGPAGKDADEEVIVDKVMQRIAEDNNALIELTVKQVDAYFNQLGV